MRTGMLATISVHLNQKELIFLTDIYMKTRDISEHENIAVNNNAI